ADHNVDDKMRDIDVEQSQGRAVVVDGIKAGDEIKGIGSEVGHEKMIGHISKCEILTTSKDDLEISCENWLEK
ncbi:5508_t:CDS:1, partial [Racocetra fulgida]